MYISIYICIYMYIYIYIYLFSIFAASCGDLARQRSFYLCPF